MPKAIMRERIEKLPGITRTWFEHERGPARWAIERVLVVEVSFSTDPDEPDYSATAIEQIEAIALAAHQDTTTAVARLRIVPSVR